MAKKKTFLCQTINKIQAFLKIGEPILCNPNSYVNIKLVLDTLHKNLNIGTDRFWTFLSCDGPPYRMASRIIESNPQYRWALLVPGLGHLHMNQMKTLFKVIDKILLEPLGKEVLNFSSKAAYDYFVSATDTHKTFQSIEILLHSTTLEICKLYLNELHHLL